MAPASFIDAFTRRALKLPRFLQPVAKLMKISSEKFAEEERIPARVKYLPPPKLRDPWPLSLYLQPSSDEDKCQNHQQTRLKTQVLKIGYPGKWKTNQGCYLSTSSVRNSNSLSSGHQSRYPDLCGQPKPQWCTSAVPYLSKKKAALPVLQTAQSLYVRAVDYHVYRLANCSTCYDKTVSSYIAKIVETVKLQMKAHFLDHIDTILIIDFLATSKLARDTRHIHEYRRYIEEVRIWQCHSENLVFQRQI